MGIKFNPFTSEFDFVGKSTGSGSGSGDVVGIPPSTPNAITRYSGTTGKLIKNSNTKVQDSGAITAAGFIQYAEVLGTTEVRDNEAWISAGLTIGPGGIVILGQGSKLVLI